MQKATKEDRDNQIDYWARLFTATSWQELRMMAEKDMYMSEASQTLRAANAALETGLKELGSEVSQLKDQLAELISGLGKDSGT